MIGAMSESQTVPISVIVPFYQGVSYLGHLTHSLARQGAAEVIVVVDGDQHTAQVIRAFESVPGSVVISTPHALGTAGARNFGASQATQPWLTFLDQDDSWPEGFINDLFSQPLEGVVAYDSDLYAQTGAEVPHPMGLSVFERDNWTTSHVSAASAELLLAGFPMVKLVIPRKEFQSVNGFRTEIVAIEDFDIVWRLLAAGSEIRMLETPRGNYVVRADSITGRIAGGDYALGRRAHRSWINVWTNFARSRAFPARARIGALRNLALTAVRSGKAVAKEAIRVRSKLHQPGQGPG